MAWLRLEQRIWYVCSTQPRFRAGSPAKVICAAGNFTKPVKEPCFPGENARRLTTQALPPRQRRLAAWLHQPAPTRQAKQTQKIEIVQGWRGRTLMNTSCRKGTLLRTFALELGLRKCETRRELWFRYRERVLGQNAIVAVLVGAPLMVLTTPCACARPPKIADGCLESGACRNPATFI